MFLSNYIGTATGGPAIQGNKGQASINSDPAEMRSKLAAAFCIDENKADLFARKFVHGYNVRTGYGGSHEKVLESMINNPDITPQGTTVNAEVFQLMRQYVDARKAGFGKEFQTGANYSELKPNYSKNNQASGNNIPNTINNVVQISSHPNYNGQNSQAYAKSTVTKGVISRMAGSRLTRLAAGVAAAAVMFTSTMPAYASQIDYEGINKLLNEAEMVSFQRADSNCNRWRKPDGEFMIDRCTHTYKRPKKSLLGRIRDAIFYRNMDFNNKEIPGSGFLKGMVGPDDRVINPVYDAVSAEEMKPDDRITIFKKKGDTAGRVLKLDEAQMYVAKFLGLDSTPSKPADDNKATPKKPSAYRTITIDNSGNAPVVTIRELKDSAELIYSPNANPAANSAKTPAPLAASLDDIFDLTLPKHNRPLIDSNKATNPYALSTNGEVVAAVLQMQSYTAPIMASPENRNLEILASSPPVSSIQNNFGADSNFVRPGSGSDIQA